MQWYGGRKDGLANLPLDGYGFYGSLLFLVWSGPHTKDTFPVVLHINSGEVSFSPAGTLRFSLSVVASELDLLMWKSQYEIIPDVQVEIENGLLHIFIFIN